MTDADLMEWVTRTAPIFSDLGEALSKCCEVVLPKDGIGTGFAQLKGRAPLIWQALQSQLAMLFAVYGKATVGRDPARIDRMLDKFKLLWEKHPDMRFGQLMCVVYAGSADGLFNFEDDKLEKLFDELIECDQERAESERKKTIAKAINGELDGDTN